MQCQPARRTRLERVHDFFRERSDFLITHARAIQREINFFVEAHGFDETIERLTGRQRASQIAEIKQPAMRVVDDRVVTQRRLARDEQLHRLPGDKPRRREIEITI